MPSIALHVWKWFVLSIWGVWWGGIFFYALFVVPIGASEFGGIEQGFVTQKVSLVHNRFSIAFLICLAVESARSRNFWLGLLSISLTVNLWLLFHFHSQLTGLMNFADRSVPSGFYAQHAIYLRVFAIEWLQGVAVPWLLLHSTASGTTGVGVVAKDSV